MGDLQYPPRPAGVSGEIRLCRPGFRDSRVHGRHGACPIDEHDIDRVAHPLHHERPRFDLLVVDAQQTVILWEHLGLAEPLIPLSGFIGDQDVVEPEGLPPLVLKKGPDGSTYIELEYVKPDELGSTPLPGAFDRHPVVQPVEKEVSFDLVFPPAVDTGRHILSVLDSYNITAIWICPGGFDVWIEHGRFAGDVLQYHRHRVPPTAI